VPEGGLYALQNTVKYFSSGEDAERKRTQDEGQERQEAKTRELPGGKRPETF